jgi:hypothetical protein
MNSNKFGNAEILDIKVTEIKGASPIQREVFEQRTINSVTDGIGALSDKVLNHRNPIGPNRIDAMSMEVTTGKTFNAE